MRNQLLLILLASFARPALSQPGSQTQKVPAQAVLSFHSNHLAPLGAGRDARALTVDGLFYEAAQGRVSLPVELTRGWKGESTFGNQIKMADGRVVKLSLMPQGHNFLVRLSAQPDSDIIRWGLSVKTGSEEYFTGLMERVVDGPQRASWAPGIKEAMDLRKQRVDMIIKPTTSVYAPFYLSSRGYAILVKSNWPGFYDFCVTDPQRVKIEFECSTSRPSAPAPRP